MRELLLALLFVSAARLETASATHAEAAGTHSGTHNSLAPSPAGINKTMAFSTSSEWPYAHNSGWALLPAPFNRIAVVFQSSRTHEGAASQVIMLATSDDGGATFSAPTTIAGNGSAAAWAPTAFADGAVLRVFFAQAPASAPTLLCGDLMHVSSADGGRTWAAPELVLSRAAWVAGVKCPDNKPAQVAPNQWALPVMSDAPRGGAVSGLIAARPGAGMAGPWAPLAGSIPSPPPPNASADPYVYPEPAIASCAAALPTPPPTWEMRAWLRNFEHTWAARSHDGGASWGAPFATPLTNPYSKVDLAVWQGGGGSAPRSGPQAGALLLAHNPVANCTRPTYCPRTPLGVSWSPDCGAAWSRPLLLETNPHGASYPTIAPCGGGRICVSYTLYDASASGCAGIAFAAFDVGLLAPM